MHPPLPHTPVPTPTATHHLFAVMDGSRCDRVLQQRGGGGGLKFHIVPGAVLDGGVLGEGC